MYGMALPNYTPERRHEIAKMLGVHEQYLYQILNGLKTASPKLASRLNRIDARARLQELRPADWQEIWPEMGKSKRTKQRAEV